MLGWRDESGNIEFWIERLSLGQKL